AGVGADMKTLPGLVVARGISSHIRITRDWSTDVCYSDHELVEQLTGTGVGGNVYYDGTTFTYVDGDGTTQTIDLGAVVQANETRSEERRVGKESQSQWQ